MESENRAALDWLWDTYNIPADDKDAKLALASTGLAKLLTALTCSTSWTSNDIFAWGLKFSPYR